MGGNTGDKITFANADASITNIHSCEISPFRCARCAIRASESDSNPPENKNTKFGGISNEHVKTRRTFSAQEKPVSFLSRGIAAAYSRCSPDFTYEPAANPKRVLTKPAKPELNDGADNKYSDYILYVNDILGVQEGQQFQILDLLGQGTFGQVVKCVNIKTKEHVAVKVIKNKPAYYNQSLVEVAILDILNNRWDRSDKYHIVYMKDTFVYRNHLCIVFEMLSVNLYELIKQNSFRGLSLSLVKLFVQQILDCLAVLSRAKIIHSDLKPENILLRSLDSPSIKVIDFGSACHENQTIYTYIQSRFYRAPEVLLGLPYTSSIDMWSLGCIAAELHLGLPLFPGTSEYNQISRITSVLGMPPSWMCGKGKLGKNFFNKNAETNLWTLKTMDSYSMETGLLEQPSKRYFAGNTLEEIVNLYPMPKLKSQAEIDQELMNRRCLLDFLNGLLKLNPFERWSPQQAKMHPFVTGAEFTGPYVPKFSQQQEVQQEHHQIHPILLQQSNAFSEIAQSQQVPAYSTSNEPISTEKILNNEIVTTESVSLYASKTGRPRANTMIQTVPPHLQKIVTIQQQSGPNKVSLRNASAAAPLPHLSSNNNGLRVINTSLNNDDVLYSSSDMKTIPVSSIILGESSKIDTDHNLSRTRSFSISQQGLHGIDSTNAENFYGRHYPLRKAVSDSISHSIHHQHQNNQHSHQNSPHHYHKQTFNKANGGSSSLDMPPLPSPNYQISESLNALGGQSGGVGGTGDLAFFEGSHLPLELLHNMNLSDTLDMGSQHHPPMGERGERKNGPSRVPSLPGLQELEFPADEGVQNGGRDIQFNGIGPRTGSSDNVHLQFETLLLQQPQQQQTPQQTLYEQRRMSMSDGYGNNSPLHRQYHIPQQTSQQPSYIQAGYVFPPVQPPQLHQYSSSPRNVFSGSPRNSFPQQQSSYLQQPTLPPPPQTSLSSSQYLNYNGIGQSGLGLYEANAGLLDHEASIGAIPGFRGRSVSLSMNTLYPLNQPWNHPISPIQPMQVQQQQQQQQNNGSSSSAANKKRPPSISTAINMNQPPQVHHQHHQQAGAAVSVSHPYSAGYQLNSASANDLTGIPPQRINHPVTLGMRRQSIVQQQQQQLYGSTPPMYSNSMSVSSSFFHGSIGIPFSQHSRIGGAGGSIGSAGAEFANHVPVAVGSLPYGHGLRGANFLNSFPSAPVLADTLINDDLGYRGSGVDEKNRKETE
ncbi:dual specificity protein kinase yak1 [Physocladia obscura]|uniref:Dual specificity protein kinase yak1 n=1 Tax=Physocladia obscura TaxID=109957 RepID=A0AAD5T460_9FUNG|nr:dual specificity protein kinase yak1 [Physocladia obscura]